MTETYSNNMERGKQYEDYCSVGLTFFGANFQNYSSQKFQLTGENSFGLEMKLDTKWPEYGNLYIEYMEKTDENNPHFVPSGILRKDNSCMWLIGNYDKAWLLSKPVLVMVFNKHYPYYKDGDMAYLAGRGIGFAEKPTSKGMLVSIKKLEEYCILLREFNWPKEDIMKRLGGCL